MLAMGCLALRRAGLSKVKRQMISSPLHLQRVLDEVFDKESEETIDVIYRCYYWMAFGGIKEDDTLLVKASDIDFANMEIAYKDTHIPLYREALPAFHKAAELNSFRYKNPNYSRTIIRDRVPGDTLMRGIRAVTKTATLRSILSKKSAKAIEDGLPSNILASTGYGCLDCLQNVRQRASWHSNRFLRSSDQLCIRPNLCAQWAD